jgi:Trypsin-like peptidase domain
MRPSTIVNALTISILALSISALSVIYPGSVDAGVVGKENREAIKDYAARRNLDLLQLRNRFMASGRIMCPFGAASAFLVHHNDVVMTARHNLFPEKQMNAYAGKGAINRCGFEITDGEKSTWHKVDVRSFVFPDDKQRSTTDRFDWIIMKLEQPLRDVVPYRLPTRPVARGLPIVAVSIRQEGFPKHDWNERIVTECTIKDIDAIDGLALSGLRTDCSATLGASGGALLREGENGLEVVGVQSSSPNERCGGYNSKSCYSFAVGMSEAVKAAIVGISSK